MKRIINWTRFYSIGILAALFFFVVGIASLSHYGLNIDEPIHFIRGQGLLHFFLTGQERYSEEDLTGSRVTTWKLQQYNGSFWIKGDSGHPPLNGILAALSNKIFYEKLGIMGDLESYHFFEVAVSSLLILLVYAIVRRKYGIFAGIISALSLGLYPLFLGESRFNIKDPIEATFFAFTIFFFYLGAEKKSGWYFFLSSFFCALALSTKFNIIFLPFIIVPYLLVRYFKVIMRLNFAALKNVPIGVYVSLVFYPIIVFVIHFATRPYLWTDPVNRFMNIIKYYQGIGTGTFYQADFVVNGWNLYAPFFIGISTPLVILFFSIIGMIASIFIFRKEKDKFSFLILLWFMLPILRAMWPGFSIYSGVRQIMEYVPAMAILSGIGTSYLVKGLIFRFSSGREFKIFNFKLPLLTFIFEVLIILLFLPIAFKLISLHPNENVFINPLVGGLKGAVERRIPGAGETMGNVYLQGIWWLNNNAEENARYHLPVGLASNLPSMFARKDLKLGNYSSEIRRKGEYMLEMISVDFPPPRYNFEYLNNLLFPVYEVKVDGTVLLKVWKNDKDHAKPGFQTEETVEVKDVQFDKDMGTITISLPEVFKLSNIDVEYTTQGCMPIERAQVLLSQNGITFKDIEYWFPSYANQKSISYPVAGRLARYINFEIQTIPACPFDINRVLIRRFK